jgi:hypothetical protein
MKLEKKNFVHLNKGLKQNILDFYSNDTALVIAQKKVGDQKQIKKSLDEIKLAKTN